MRTIRPIPLTKENFAPFGQYYTMGQPDGYALCGAIHKFYPDRITGDAEHRLGFSPLVVSKPERMIITQQEYHLNSWEILLPLDDDMIIHVAPASAGKPVPDEVKAFIVPKNTMVKLNTAIWHLAPLPVNNDKVTVMVVLPEATYVTDCIVVDLNEEEQFEIVK